MNKRHERFKFQSRKQMDYIESTKQAETAEEYLRELQRLVRTCEYHDEEDQVLDRFVLRIRNNTLSKKLQLKADLTLEEAFRTVRLSEQVEKQKAEQDQFGRDPQVSEVKGQRRGHNYNRGQGRRRGFTQKTTPKTPQKTQQCEKFGGSHGKCCPASGKQCNYCHKVGHFISVCRKRMKKSR